MAAYLAFAVAPQLVRAADEKLAFFSADAHARTIEAMHSLEGRFTSQFRHDESGRMMPGPSGTFTRIDGGFRVGYRSTDRVPRQVDLLVKDGKVVSLTDWPNGKATKFGAVDPLVFANQVDPDVNVEFRALFAFYAYPTNGSYRLPDLFRMSRYKIARAERGTDGPNEFVTVELRDEEFRTNREFTIDPAKGHLIRKVTAYRDLDGRPRSVSAVTEVVRFAEPAPGFYFPAEVRFRGPAKGGTHTTHTYTFSDVKINRPNPVATALTFPPGALVHDKIRQVEYSVGADGRAVNERPLSVAPTPAPARTSGDGPWADVPPAGGEATQEEAGGPARYVVLTSLAVLGVAATVAFLNRFRRGNRISHTGAGR